MAREVEKEFPGVHVAITGGHRMSVDNATMIKADAARCIHLGMAAMLVLCLSAFRRRWLALIGFLAIVFRHADGRAWCWRSGSHHLSAIATGFASIAIGITVDYAIYVIYHLDDAAESGPRFRGSAYRAAGSSAHQHRRAHDHRRVCGHGEFAHAWLSATRHFWRDRRGVFGGIRAGDPAVARADRENRARSRRLWLTRLMERFHTLAVKLAARGCCSQSWSVTIVTAFGVRAAAV